MTEEMRALFAQWLSARYYRAPAQIGTLLYLLGSGFTGPPGMPAREQSVIAKSLGMSPRSIQVALGALVGSGAIQSAGSGSRRCYWIAVSNSTY